MSYRDLPPAGDEQTWLFRQILDRLDALEAGQQNLGRTSFGNEIQLGDVTVTVIETSATGRSIRFTNALTGASSTIPL